MAAAEEHVGKQSRCPGCQQIFTIPALSPGVKPAPAVERRKPPALESPPVAKKKAQPVDGDDEAIAEIPSRAKRAVAHDEDEDDVPRRKPLKKQARNDDDDDDRRRRKKRRDDDEDDEDNEFDFERDDSRRRRRRRGPYADCPGCGCRGDATKVSWTWWGGIIGPLFINTVRCNRCGVHYNGTHGDYNGTRIAIYVGISLVLGLGIACIGVLANTHQ
jgi:hypothetical protein